jgi:SAM-dependent methyltransferase
MTDWTAGYVAEIGYTFGYYQELNPLHINLVFLNVGLTPPSSGTHCELGYGQGISANIHAAASDSSWFGTDFNPAQAAFAKSLAAASGADAHFTDQAFAEFCTRPDLPDFDSIGLHGIWSWINDENRSVIVDFVKRKLKLGGVLYVSYNCQPGWAATTPMRDLLIEHAEVMGVEGRGLVSRIDGALDFAEKLFATNPSYIKANPMVAQRLNEMQTYNRNYLAHEYFNRDWLPMPFYKMAHWLVPAKLRFACDADVMGHIDAVNLTGEQQNLLKEIPDAMFRETVRDFMVNQAFRKDYWVKGGTKLRPLEQQEAIRAQEVMLIIFRTDVSLKVVGKLGEATMREAVYAPILDALADYKRKTIGQLERVIADHKIGFPQLLEAMLVLVGCGAVAMVQDIAIVSKAKKQTDKLNAFLLNKCRTGSEIFELASPVTGGGVTVTRFHQFFMLALTQGKTLPADWALFAWEILMAQGLKILKEGERLETSEENIAELNLQASEFETKRLPILRMLQII